MKRILLASTAIVAFAGAAAAEGHTGVTFSGSAVLGYNDTVITPGLDLNDGFYSDLEATIGFAAELDNGLTVAASVDLNDFIDNDQGTQDGGDDVVDFELSVTSETAGLFYGDTNFAAQNVWVSAGDMEGDNFSEADGEEAIRGEVTFNGIEAQLSYVIANDGGTRVADAGNDSDLDQLSLGVSADFGNFNVVAAYQEDSGVIPGSYAGNGDFVEDEVFGISVGTSFAGADVRLAYAQNSGSDNDSSIGVQVAYPFGPVTATAYYVVEDSDFGNDDDNWGINLAYSNGPIAVEFDYDDDQGTQKYGLEGSYDVGNGLTVFAGVLYFEGLADEEAFYVAGTYDLGSGAELLVSYAEGDDVEYEDEIGAGDYQEGTTVEVSFSF